NGAGGEVFLGRVHGLGGPEDAATLFDKGVAGDGGAVFRGENGEKFAVTHVYGSLGNGCDGSLVMVSGLWLFCGFTNAGAGRALVARRVDGSHRVDVALAGQDGAVAEGRARDWRLGEALRLPEECSGGRDLLAVDGVTGHVGIGDGP